MIQRIVVLVALALFQTASDGSGQLSRWQLGGDGGQAWSDWSALNIMMDTESVPGSIQPFELNPEQNILSRLGPWARWQEPRDSWWRPGLPRIWRGNVAAHKLGADWDPLTLLDGDPTTGNALRNFGNPLWKEFYTIDLGTEVPVERFRFFPPDGVDELSGEPFRPGYAQRNYELTASNDAASQMRQADSAPGLTRDVYDPLEILLARVENNFEWDAQVRFPLEHLRLIRWRPMSDDLGRVGGGSECTFPHPHCGEVAKFGISELELYGRGFVRSVTWESRVADLERIANIGQVHFGFSSWRREGDRYVEAPGAPVAADVELQIGLDDTPSVYYTYDTMGRLVEASENEWANKLKHRQWPWHPAGVGWRGPIADDTSEWSFWSAPLEQSGDRPRLPRGRYLRVRVRLETDSLWEFARLDSLVVVSSPLLAERVLGEVAVMDDLEPSGNVAQVTAGELTELVYEMEGKFFDAAQPGFDALRLSSDAGAIFLGLETGDPLSAVVPDSVVQESDGFAVYLPHRIDENAAPRLRLRLQLSMYDAAGEVRGEVFDRAAETLPQTVEPGDVSDEMGTNQLRLLAVASSLGNVLDAVEVRPESFTPQGDGINDEARVEYSLFSVRSTQVDIEVFTLGGSRVRGLYSGTQSAGRHVVRWDGRDDSGQMSAPGLYLMLVAVEADEGRHEHLQPVAVAY